MELLFWAKEVEAQKSFSFLNLSTNFIHWIFHDFKGVDCTIKVCDFTSHGDEHGS